MGYMLHLDFQVPVSLWFALAYQKKKKREKEGKREKVLSRQIEVLMPISRFIQ